MTLDRTNRMIGPFRGTVREGDLTASERHRAKAAQFRSMDDARAWSERFGLQAIAVVDDMFGDDGPIMLEYADGMFVGVTRDGRLILRDGDKGAA